MQGASEVQSLPKMLFNLNSCVNVASGTQRDVAQNLAGILA